MGFRFQCPAGFFICRESGLCVTVMNGRLLEEPILPILWAIFF
jgi:hypothetical protein